MTAGTLKEVPSFFYIRAWELLLPKLWAKDHKIQVGSQLQTSIQQTCQKPDQVDRDKRRGGPGIQWASDKRLNWYAEAMMSCCPDWEWYKMWVGLPLQRNVTDTPTGSVWGNETKSILYFQLCLGKYGDMLRSAPLLLKTATFPSVTCIMIMITIKIAKVH